MSGQELVVQKALELSAQLKKLSSHPYLEVLHFFMVCMLFRKDTCQKKGGLFPRDFKLAGWLMSLLMCFSDSIISNLIIGEPLVTPFKNPHKIVIATFIWYLVNYSPRDLIFKLAQLRLVTLMTTWLWTLGLVGKINSGIQYGGKHFYNQFFIIALLGVCKGAGHLLMNWVLKVVNGTNNEIDNLVLYPTFQLKCSVFTSVLFTMFKSNYFSGRTPFVYLGVVFLYLYSSVSSIMSPQSSEGGGVGADGGGDEAARDGGYTARDDVFSPIEGFLTYVLFNNPLLHGRRHDSKTAERADEGGRDGGVVDEGMQDGEGGNDVNEG